MSQQKPNIHCSQCGTAFRCGATAGESTCWCASLPRVMPVPKEGEATGCLCPNCLQEAIDKTVANLSKGQGSNNIQKV